MLVLWGWRSFVDFAVAAEFHDPIILDPMISTVAGREHPRPTPEPAINVVEADSDVEPLDHWLLDLVGFEVSARTLRVFQGQFFCIVINRVPVAVLFWVHVVDLDLV